MKILLLTIATLCYINAEAQLRIGVQGGYNSARISPSQSSSVIYNYATTSFRGFQAGAVAEARLAHNWFLRQSFLVNGREQD